MHIEVGQIWKVTKPGFTMRKQDRHKCSCGNEHSVEVLPELPIGSNIEIRYPYEWHFRTEENEYGHNTPEELMDKCIYVGTILNEVRWQNKSFLKDILASKLYTTDLPAVPALPAIPKPPTDEELKERLVNVFLGDDSKRISYFTEGYTFSDCPFLFETKDVTLGSVFKYKGRHYAVRVLSHKRAAALAFAITIKKWPFTSTIEEELLCPVCGAVQGDSWELSDSSDDYECSACGSTLAYSTEVSRTFTASVVRPACVTTIVDA